MSSDEADDPIGTVDEQAAEWVVRQDGVDLDADERRRFDAWLADPRHRAAFEQQRAVWRRFQRAGPRVPEAAQSPARRRVSRHSPIRSPASRKIVATAIAASLALVAVGAFDLGPAWLRADHATGAGERRQITLADGSSVQLDGRSAIALDYSADRRVVRLLEGSAYFRVAPDKARPFVAEAGAGTVTALGTAFAVRERDGEAELAVTEHRVRVRTGAGQVALVREGQGVRFGADRVTAPAKMDVAAATAWTRGKLIVFDRPLAEVVAEIGSQRRGYWTVTGEAAAIRVNGVYDLDRPLEALEALERTHGLSSFRLTDRLIVLRR